MLYGILHMKLYFSIEHIKLNRTRRAQLKARIQGKITTTGSENSKRKIALDDKSLKVDYYSSICAFREGRHV